MTGATHSGEYPGDGPRITALLGPTNTGKTHFAIERLLAHESGMIGFPLRLLARENYERVVAMKGADKVALVTGEEKIVPEGARYFLCTVESMPLDKRVAFLGVDEVQLAADPDRGHIFTERMMTARGTQETMFMGAGTVAKLLRQLVPEAEIVTRPRMSKLGFAGAKKITRLPRRSAIVAFSASDVYAIAEVMRRRRGGTAVVMGALSPRTRNAQVEMYQAGEVDFLVATDAIGMGLNLNVRHVAFSSLVKFDGRHPRRLSHAEIAQIAGRAGRHVNDGTFGTTADCGAMDPEAVEAVEGHSFPPLRILFWRNADLQMHSLAHLRSSLEAPLPHGFLRRAREADDYQALIALSAQDDVRAVAKGGDAVALLWDVCQIPDFRKILSDHHTRLLGQVYLALAGPAGRLDPDWVAKQVARIDRTDGDIDTLAGRIAAIRTWTYIAYRRDWLEHAAEWQERTRAIEDRLSDALHERLTQRFVDVRSAALVRSLDAGAPMAAAVNAKGEVIVEGHIVGHLEGFRFTHDAAADGEDARAILNAASRALRTDVETRVRRLETAPASELALLGDGGIEWQGAPVARLAQGGALLAPRIAVLDTDLLDPAQRDRVSRRLEGWLQERIARDLGPLVRLPEADLAGPARGIAFQLAEAMGTVPRAAMADQIAALKPADRKALRAAGVRLGRVSVYLPGILGKRPDRLRRRLAAAQFGCDPDVSLGALFTEAGAEAPAAFWKAAGYLPVGDAAIRADALERLAAEAYKLGKQGPFSMTAALRRILGGPDTVTAAALASLGFRAREENGAVSYALRRGGRPKAKSKPDAAGTGARKPKPGKRKPAKQPDPASPFAKLKELNLT